MQNQTRGYKPKNAQKQRNRTKSLHLAISSKKWTSGIEQNSGDNQRHRPETENCEIGEKRGGNRRRKSAGGGKEHTHTQTEAERKERRRANGENGKSGKIGATIGDAGARAGAKKAGAQTRKTDYRGKIGTEIGDAGARGSKEGRRANGENGRSGENRVRNRRRRRAREQRTQARKRGKREIWEKSVQKSEAQARAGAENAGAEGGERERGELGISCSSNVLVCFPKCHPFECPSPPSPHPLQIQDKLTLRACGPGKTGKRRRANRENGKTGDRGIGGALGIRCSPNTRCMLSRMPPSKFEQN